MPQNIFKCSQLVKVQIKQGIVIGQLKTLPSGNLFQIFQGIPYAVPPVGELRFKSPLPLKTFGVPELACLKERNISYQRNPFTTEVVGSEDCLFLNVYAPTISKHSSKALPVMVWIHGGGFMFGNGNSDYHLPLNLVEEDVIVVTLNYRLGALGFLCLPEEGIWGNAGLKDQRLALQWLQDNIQAFGGDPNNVTLFGESAGAASIHMHVLSGHANLLFHKAIMQSGSANMEWVFQSNAAYKVRRLGELLGFTAKDTKMLLSFLQSPAVQPLDILKNTPLVTTSDERRRSLPFIFKPVIEDCRSPDSFITEPILDRINKPNSIQIPLIMGYNSGEGIVMMPHALNNLETLENDFHRLVPKNIELGPENDNLKTIAKNMRDFYLNGNSIKPELFDNLKNIFSDYYFVMDLQHAAKKHALLQPHAPLYFYRFDYVGDRHTYKSMLGMQMLSGACHGDELFYLFQMAGDDTTVSDRDRNMMNQLSNLWSNFAKYANPTPQNHHPQLISCQWLPVKKPKNREFTLNYLAIQNDGYQMKQNPDRNRMKFWTTIYSLYAPKDISKL